MVCKHIEETEGRVCVHTCVSARDFPPMPNGLYLLSKYRDVTKLTDDSFINHVAVKTNMLFRNSRDYTSTFINLIFDACRT